MSIFTIALFNLKRFIINSDSIEIEFKDRFLLNSTIKIKKFILTILFFFIY